MKREDRPDVMACVAGEMPVGAGVPGTLTHLQRLEAESIHIMREVVAECEQAGDALFDRQGQLGDAAPGA